MRSRRTTLAAGSAAALAIGLSSVILSAAPASAAYSCGLGGVAIGGNVCELTFTASASFTAPAGTSKLEALLVGGGGNGYSGYGGGGGAVSLVNFADTSTPLAISVGSGGDNIPITPATASTVTQGLTASAAAPGENGSTSGSATATGGASGNGNTTTGNGVDILPAIAGAGAGASPAGYDDGGAGLVVSDIAPAGSLFATDTACYGGGGGVEWGGEDGSSSCGAGSDNDEGGAAPDAVSGTGSGGGSGVDTDASGAGASGVVVVRWMVDATVTFDLDGHGSPIASQQVAPGGVATQPATPTAAGQLFGGWYTDPALTTKADFSAPITADTTLYASWIALAETGVSISPWAMPGAAGSLVLGAALVVWSRRRFRRV